MKSITTCLFLVLAIIGIVFVSGCIGPTKEGPEEETPIAGVQPEGGSQRILEIEKEVDAIGMAVSLRLNDLESGLPQEPAITRTLVISKSCSIPDCYASLQEAADHASEGTLIKFEYGEYTFSGRTEINKSNLVIDCQGATLKDPDSSRIDGMLRFEGVHNDVVKNCNIIQTNEGKSIYFFKSHHNIIKNNTIRGVVGTIVLAILLDNSSHNLVEVNRVDDTHDAISFWENSSYNLARHNQGSRNEKLVLVHLSENNIVFNNTASYNTNDGIYLATSHNNMIVSNTLYMNDHCGMHIKQVNWEPELGGSHNNIVFNNRIVLTRGIELGSGNLNGAGLDLQYSENNTVASNVIEGNFNGLFLVHNSASNRLINNTIINNSGSGLEFSEAKNNYAMGNTACNNTGPDFHGGDPSRSLNNIGKWNACNRTENWNDANATGCTFAC